MSSQRCQPQPFSQIPTWSVPAWLIALLLFLTTACAPLTPTTPSSPIPTPARFSTSGEAELPDQWWQSFNDPQLAQLIDQALAANLSLRATWDRLRQAEAMARRSGSDLVPHLDGTGSATTSREDDGGSTQSSNSATLGLAASYELDLWGRIRSRRDAARYDAAASAEELHTAALTLSAQVASVWYQLVEQRGQIRLLDQQHEIDRQVLKLVTFRFRRGQVGASDVLQQRQLVEANRGQQALAKSQALVLEHQLAILLGQAPGSVALPASGDLTELPPLPRSGLPADLLQRRPDLRAALAKVRAADARLAAAIADRLPRFSLAAEASTEGGDGRDLFHNWLASLAANLVAPLVDGGYLKAEAERSRAVADEALNTYGQAALAALAEVEDGLAREQGQRQYLDRLANQLRLAGQGVNQVRGRYLRGQEGYLRVLDAQLSQQTLERSLLTARRQLIDDRINLCRALAGGWQLTPPERRATAEQESTNDTATR